MCKKQQSGCSKSYSLEAITEQCLKKTILGNCISYIFGPFFTEHFSLPKSQYCTVFPLTAFYFFQHHLVLTLLLLLPVFSVLVFCSVNQSRHFLLSHLRWKIVYHVQFSPDFVVDSGSWLGSLFNQLLH